MSDSLRLPDDVELLEAEVQTELVFRGDDGLQEVSILDAVSATDLDMNAALMLLLRNQKIMIEEARRRERRHYRFEQSILRELDLVRDQLKALGPAPVTFPQFRRFPTEIRQRIWELAIPTRVFVHHSNDPSFASSPVRPPAINGVCTESRAVASRLGRYHRVSTFADPRARPNIRWLWFTPDTDILLLGNTHRTPSVEHLAKRVFFDLGYPITSDSLEPPFAMKGELGRIDYYLNLEEVHIGPKFLIGKGLSPAAVSELFAGNPARLLDLNDIPLVERIVRIIEQEQGPNVSPKSHSKSILLALKQYRDEFMKGLPTYQKQLVIGRANEMRRVKSAELLDESYLGADGFPNTKVEWVQELLTSYKWKPSILFVHEDARSSYPDWMDRER